MVDEASELRKLRADLRKVARELTGHTEIEVRDKGGGPATTKRGQPLLEQLRDAVNNGGGAGGKRAGTGSPELVSLAALALLQQVEQEVARLHLHAVQQDRVTVDERVKAVVALAGRWTDADATAAGLKRLSAMAEQIRDLLDPAKRLTVPAACPICNQRTAWRKVDGEKVQVQALSLDVHTGRCVCLSCDAAWEYQHLELLTRMITHAQQKPEGVEEAQRREVRSGTEGTAGRTPPGTRQCTGACGEVKVLEQFPLLSERMNPGVRARSSVCATCWAEARRAQGDTPPDPDGQVA